MDAKKEKAARRLIGAMAKKQMRQQDLADRSGVTKSSISHYVNGQTIPDKERAFKLARVLDVTPEYLMCEDDSDFMIVEKNELQREIAQMGPDQLARLLEYALFLKNKKDGAE